MRENLLNIFFFVPNAESDTVKIRLEKVFGSLQINKINHIWGYIFRC